MEKPHELLQDSAGSAYSVQTERVFDDLSILNNGNPNLISSRTIKRAPKESINAFYHNSQILFRLFVKKGEFVYARPEDIIMIESCDHLVKVYLGIGDKVKLTVRNNTLKDFLALLPQTQFSRISRFCAVNIKRISGSNSIEQVLEFDFKHCVKLKHAVSHSVFSNIGK